MYSFNFPNMVSNSTSNLLKDKEAVRSNVKLVLASEVRSLYGDPYFGSHLKRAIFEQSTAIVSDLLIDEIYTTLITFIPQIALQRRDIKLAVQNKVLYATIKYTFTLDNTSDLYVINLIDTDDSSSTQ